MRTIDEIRELYNAGGVHPTTDPDDPKSQFVVDRYKPHLCKLIKPGMRALDLGCNAGRLTFVMEDLGATATGIDCAEIPIFHAINVAQKRKSQCQFNIGDIAALPYKEDSFDFALLPQNTVELSYQAVETLAVQLKQILSDKGLFVVFMHDEFIKRAGEQSFLERYDARTGFMGGHSTFPDKGTYAYPSFFWTVAFAKHIIEKHHTLTEVSEIAENKFMMVFCNKKGKGGV